MEDLIALWMPIVGSTVAVWIASFVLWTIAPHHKPDYKKLPGEDEFLETVRNSGARPGMYMFPWCDWKEKDAEAVERYKRGPNGYINIWPGAPSMGRNMILTVVFLLVVNIFIAYVLSQVFEGRANVEYLHVFQVVGTVGIMAYCFGSILHDIWFGKPLRAMVMDFVDGVVYALLTAGIFGWLGSNVLSASGS